MASKVCVVPTDYDCLFPQVSVVVNVQIPEKLVISTQPNGCEAGSACTTQPQLAVKDASVSSPMYQSMYKCIRMLVRQPVSKLVKPSENQCVSQLIYE